MVILLGWHSPWDRESYEGDPTQSQNQCVRLGLPKSKSCPRWAILEYMEWLRSQQGKVSVGSHLSQHLLPCLSSLIGDCPSGADRLNEALVRTHGRIRRAQPPQTRTKRDSTGHHPPSHHVSSPWIHVD